MIQQHGGNIDRLENILDLSANINPLGLPERVRAAIAESIPDAEKYPDPGCTVLRERLADLARIPAENIVCGNGADDLIFRIVHALRPKKLLSQLPRSANTAVRWRKRAAELTSIFSGRNGDLS